MRRWGWLFGQTAGKPMPPSDADEELEPDLALRLQEPSLRRKLERYFSKLWQIYPDGVVVRLNTGHKKLAERGAQLRHRLGLEGDLDGFFALGGMVYRRSSGGRPAVSLSPAEREALLSTLRSNFPDGVPTLNAVKQHDHSLYLTLRTAARKQSCTMTEWLRRHGLMKKKSTKGVVFDGTKPR